MKSLLSHLIVSLVVSATLIGVYHYSGWDKKQDDPNWLELVGYHPEGEAHESPAQAPTSEPATHSNQVVAAAPDSTPATAAYRTASLDGAPANFRMAAGAAMPAVVHIKAISRSRQGYNLYYDFFGLKPRQSGGQQVSTGSGVILTSDGYIVTNNHVIQSADELTVTLYDNRNFTATVIGTDPSTDLGLIKIEGEEFPFLDLANSDQAKVGDWVLAVGNPFNLSSTATAGIVSAIGRDLEIIEDQAAIESFIQTDAAVNPGNSGGALVNLDGQLIGVNTAIASPTGTYAGYAFAVPANIVRKVIDDLREYGMVQRAYLGIRYATDLNGQIAQQRNLNLTEGVLVEEVVDFGGAKKAGIKKGDVIVEIEGVPVRNDAKMLELVGRNRPGDVIKVKIYRNGNYRDLDVQLTDNSGRTEVKAPARNEMLSELGLALADLPTDQQRMYGIDYGVQVTRLSAGKIRKQTDMKQGFVILRVNGQTAQSTQQVIDLIQKANGVIRVDGFYPRYQRIYSYEFRK